MKVVAQARTRGIAALPVVLGAGLFVLTLAGCGPSSDKTAKQAGTNAVTAVQHTVARTNHQEAPKPPGVRPGVKNSPPPALARPAGKAGPVPFAARGVMGTKPSAPAARVGSRTNAATVAAQSVAGTNAALTAAGKPGFAETLRGLAANRAFYPTAWVVFVCLCLGVVLAVRLLKARAGKSGTPGQQGAALSAAAKPARRKTGRTTIRSCNILQVGAQEQHLWQFDARGRGFALNREQTSAGGERLPARIISKDWRSLWHSKLNVAWLPPEQVFLRVAQFPASDYEETVAMVELQLEKLSPMPVAQIVWSLYVLPQTEGNLQTVIVMIVARSTVEEFLGQLEGQGFLADRLEMPLLDQLQATAVTGDGAWIYPDAAGGRNAALVAWWYGGALRNLDLITLPAANRPEALKEQLLQMAWAGELEGWLTGAPAWHLVADAPIAAEWEPALRTGLEQPIEVHAPVPVADLAALTATRAAQAGSEGNLLPAEFSTRYRQQFVDRLWMRGLGAVVGLYLVGVLIYFARLEVELYRTNAVEQQVAELGPTYTNALRLKAKYQVLKDRQDLKYAALDCWKVVAELLPEGVTLDGFNFSDGKKLTLSGNVPSDQVKRLWDFDADIRKAAVNGQPLFDANGGDHISYHDGPGGTKTWNCVLELKRKEAL
jgi:hypothetical protein